MLIHFYKEGVQQVALDEVKAVHRRAPHAARALVEILGLVCDKPSRAPRYRYSTVGDTYPDDFLYGEYDGQCVFFRFWPDCMPPTVTALRFGAIDDLVRHRTVALQRYHAVPAP